MSQNQRRRNFLLFTFSLLLIGYFFRATLFSMKNQIDYAGSEQFEKMKELVGSWEGKGGTKSSANDEKVYVEYKLTSGGSAIVETLNPGTPMEMMTVYYDQSDGSFALTHYCSLHNHPKMNLESWNKDELNFELEDDSDIDRNNEVHMHALNIIFENKDKITQVWSLYEKGKLKSKHTFNLSRKK